MASKRGKCSTAECPRDARHPGPFCGPCWRAAGQPTTEQIAEQRATQRLRDEGLVPAGPAVPELSDERTDDLGAMQHVWDGYPVRTRQQAGFAEMLAAEGRGKFLDRMQRFRKGGAGEDAGEPAESIVSEVVSDPSTAKLRSGKDLLAEEFALVDRLHRNLGATVSFWDREGLA